MAKKKASSGKATKRNKRRTRKPEVRVVLDTNQLYVGSASDLLRNEVADLIVDCRRHKDVQFAWFLPDVVRQERQYQMNKLALEFLPRIGKLERLLGHNLALTDTVLKHHVGDRIEEQIEALGIGILGIDAAAVDWDRVIRDSTSRTAPFQPGEHEKGFRDAVILECFLQLVASSPKTAATCRLVLVTNDGLLRTSVKTRTSTAKNVRTLASLDELRDLINTLVSEVEEDFVNGIRDAASLLFLDQNSDTCLYHSEAIRNQINDLFGSELCETADGASSRENGNWYIKAPRFQKKQGQRVTWISPIEVEAEAFNTETYITHERSVHGTMEEVSPSTVLYRTPKVWNVADGAISVSPNVIRLAGASSGAAAVGASHIAFPTTGTTKRLVAKGRSVFEVKWTVTVTATQRMSNARIDDITFVETSWE